MRADIFLVQFGYLASREKAKRLIGEGLISVDGRVIRKAAEEIDEESCHAVCVTDPDRYVSRGGYKLEAALEAFGISPEGMTCLDIGASTGGFTDCLLQKGAKRVIAVDAGTGQLAPSLRGDERVTGIEHYNARNLCLADLGERVDLAVLDVSFISQTYILPHIPEVLKPGGYYIGLVKPQFEAGRSALGKGGIVRDRGARLGAALRVYEAGIASGLCPVGFLASPIAGGDGNREYLICFSVSGQNGLSPITPQELERHI